MLPERVNVLGVGVHPITIALALDTIDSWIARQEQHYVCVSGVHGVMECQRDPALRQIHNRAGLVTPDGMPLVWLSRFNGHRQADRVYGPDLMLAACERFSGYRHYLYGSSDKVLEGLSTNLQQRFPALQIVGTFSPPFRQLTMDEDQEIVEMMNQTEPDIVWVGLSTPKQERWMAEHIGKLTAPVLIGVGAAFDFHAGLKPQAPLWMQRNGLEWFFRLLTEPQRLWRRYLLNNPLFVWLVLQQYLRVQQYPCEW